jgi:hypothetical protein
VKIQLCPYIEKKKKKKKRRENSLAMDIHVLAMSLFLWFFFCDAGVLLSIF